MTREELEFRWEEFVGEVRRAIGSYAADPRLETEGEIQMDRAEDGIEASEEDHRERAGSLNQPPPRPRVFQK